VDSSTGDEFRISSSRARPLSPSTFCVISVKVASGAVRSRIDSIENLARAVCAALGLAAKALGDVVESVLWAWLTKGRQILLMLLTFRAYSGRIAIPVRDSP
jgi:hypothetical protein